MSLLPRLICWFYGCVAVRGSGGGDIGVEFGLVAESNKLFAGDAAMGEIPTVEMAVAVGFSRIGDGGYGKGSGYWGGIHGGSTENCLWRTA